MPCNSLVNVALIPYWKKTNSNIRDVSSIKILSIAPSAQRLSIINFEYWASFERVPMCPTPVPIPNQHKETLYRTSKLSCLIKTKTLHCIPTSKLGWLTSKNLLGIGENIHNHWPIKPQFSKVLTTDWLCLDHEAIPMQCSCVMQNFFLGFQY